MAHDITAMSKSCDAEGPRLACKSGSLLWTALTASGNDVRNENMLVKALTMVSAQR